MLINYWNCDYSDYDESYDGDRYYGCTHPDNPSHCCDLDNKYFDEEKDCKYLKADNNKNDNN